MSETGTITAEFTPARHLSIAVVGGGTVTPGAGEYDYPEGDQIYIAATAQAGWHFDHWQGLRNDAVEAFFWDVTESGYLIAYFVEDPSGVG